MASKVWFARTLFYFSSYLRSLAPVRRRAKARLAQRSKLAPATLLKPLRAR